MPLAQKNPTQTQAIVSGWNNPANAYTEDGVNADASPPNTSTCPEQKYTGFGFTETDIPAGSTITKVEMGTKHYETDPTGYYAYTSLKYVRTNGSSVQYMFPKRSSLTWDWFEITGFESGWTLQILNNADVRAIASIADAGGGGCYVETDNEKTYVIVKLPDDTFTLKPCSELAIDDLILVWEWEKGLIFTPVEKVESSKLVQEDVVEIWSGQVNLKPVIDRDVNWRSHTTVTKLQRIPLYKKERDFVGGTVLRSQDTRYAGPFMLTAEELHRRVVGGERYWMGHLWYKWTIEPMPVDMTAVKTVNGKSYKIMVADKNSNIIVKSLMKHELEHLNSLGLTLLKQAEVGPPFMGIAMKETSYSDSVALRVTYNPPTSGGFSNIGEGMVNQTILS
jgi:hypothetical protein